MPNLGDVALNLPREWDRSRMSDKSLALIMVGHTDGKPDAFLTADPEKQHQFRWIDPTRPEDIDLFQTDHYSFVNKNEGWEKNPNLWTWNAEGRLVGRAGQLMARDAKWYHEEKAEQERKAGVGEEAEDAKALALAASMGIDVTDLDGKSVKRGPGRPRKA